MEFLIISQFAGSSYHGMVLRNYNWAKELAARGHNVTILTSSFAHHRSKQAQTNGLFTTEIIDGITYIWCKNIRYKAQSTLGRLTSIALFQAALAYFRFTSKEHYDVVIASSPHPFQIYPARALARKHGAKLVYDIRDLWPLTLKELGNVGDAHPFIWLMQRAENFACRHADLVTAVPANCEDYLKGHGLADEKFMALGNGLVTQPAVKAASVKLPADLQDTLDRLALDKNSVTIGYAGALGTANAMRCFITALAHSPSHIHAVIVGQGPEKEMLQSYAKECGIGKRVTFFAPIPHDQIQTFLALTDYVYAGTQKKALYQYGASLTKLNDYMLAAKPVIYAVGDPQNAVERSDCGICCEAENSEEIAAAMAKISGLSEEERRIMGERGKAWLLENNLVKTQMESLVTRLQSL